MQSLHSQRNTIWWSLEKKFGNFQFSRRFYKYKTWKEVDHIDFKLETTVTKVEQQWISEGEWLGFYDVLVETDGKILKIN